MTITSARLLRGVKRRITMPANQVLIDDSGILELADDVMRDFMVPMIVSTRQNYFVVTDDLTITENQKLYDIPYRYLARGLRDLKYSVDGTETGIINLTLIAIEDEHLFAQSGQPSGFYFKGDQIALCPAPINTSQYIQFWGEIPPSNLCQVSAAAFITGISRGDPTTTITVSSLPTTMTAGVLIDFIQGIQGNRLLGFDNEITNAAATQLTFDADDVPDALVVGDWISIAQTSPVVMMPDDVYPLYESKICARILYAVGDYDGQAKLEADAMRQETDIKKVLEPRIQGEPVKIVNRRGLLRGRCLPWWWNRGYYP